MSLGYSFGPPAGIDPVVPPSKIPSVRAKNAVTNGAIKYTNGSSEVVSNGTSNGLHPTTTPQKVLPLKRTFAAMGGSPISLRSSKKLKDNNNNNVKKTQIPYIVFSDVVCTSESYQIDVFAPNSRSHIADPVTNPGFIGHVSRLGMGEGSVTTGGLRNKERCDKSPVTRCLDARKWTSKLKKGSLEIVVTKLQTGEVVDEDTWKSWKGFVPTVHWILE